MSQKNKYTTPTEILKECSFFRSVADKVPRLISWDNIVNGIRTNTTIKDNTERAQVNSSDKYLYSKYKAKSGAITPAAQCIGGHNASNIATLTGISMVDLDHLDPKQIPAYLEIIKSDPHTFIAYITCSGAGIRVLFPYTASEPEIAYVDAWRWGNQYYAMITGEKYDEATKDASRLSYLCHDPNCYYNPDARPFYIDNAPHETVITTNSNEPLPIDRAEQILARQGMHYVQGERHHFLLNAAFLLNKMGIDKEQVIAHYSDQHEDPKEVARIINWAYDKASNDHGSWNNSKPQSKRISTPLKSTTTSPNNDETATPETKKTMPSRNKVASPEQIRQYLDENIKIRRNEVTRFIEYFNPEKKSWVEGTDLVINALWEDACIKLGYYIRQADFRSELYSEKTPMYHPLRDYLDHLKPWSPEKPDYITELANRVTVKGDQELFVQCFTKWFVAMVASWMYDGVINHEILVLIGPQGIFKSTFVRRLLPTQLDRYYLAKGNAGFTKDDTIALAERALIAHEEIDALRDFELNIFKALSTTEVISERAAYARFRENRPHLASFCATGNNTSFLNDPTGNRRFLPFTVEHILNPFDHPLNYDKIYAQARYLVEHGFQYWFTYKEDQQLETHRLSFTVPCIEEEFILRHFRPQPLGLYGQVDEFGNIIKECNPDEKGKISPLDRTNENGDPIEVAEFFTTADIIGVISNFYRGAISQKRVSQILTKLGWERRYKGKDRGYVLIQNNLDEIKSNRINRATEVIKSEQEATQPILPQQRTILQDIEEQDNPFLTEWNGKKP